MVYGLGVLRFRGFEPVSVDRGSYRALLRGPLDYVPDLSVTDVGFRFQGLAHDLDVGVKLEDIPPPSTEEAGKVQHEPPPFVSTGIPCPGPRTPCRTYSTGITCDDVMAENHIIIRGTKSPSHQASCLQLLMIRHLRQ